MPQDNAADRPAFPYDRKAMTAALQRRPGRARLEAPEIQRFTALIEQAEVAADKLTKSKHWNVYQQIVQAMIEHAQATLADVLVTLQDPSVVNAEQVQLLRYDVFRLNERIEVLELCLGIPKMLVDGGQDMASVLRKIGGDDGNKK